MAGYASRSYIQTGRGLSRWVVRLGSVLGGVLLATVLKPSARMMVCLRWPTPLLMARVATYWARWSNDMRSVGETNNNRQHISVQPNSCRLRKYSSTR